MLSNLDKKQYRRIHCHLHPFGPHLMEKIRVHLKIARNEIYKGDIYQNKM